MVTYRLLTFLMIFAAFCSNGLFAAEPNETALTVYNDNFAVVRQSRQMDFEQGVNEVKFTGVAANIDPTSVNFKCLSAPGAVSILEQNYQYDLVNANKLLDRYIEKKVSLWIADGADDRKYLQGTLMAAVGGDLIIKTEDGIEIVNRADLSQIILEELPDDLLTRPTLIWLAKAKKSGSQLCRIAYTTDNVNWNADYSVILNPDDTRLDFSGWVTINNRSGIGYENAKLKLIAGDVRRIRQQRGRQPQAMYEMAARAASADKAGFKEKGFMEYHMYTLGRRTTVKNNEVKQIEFIEPAEDVAVDKIFVYEKKPRWFYQRDNQEDKIRVELEFKNTEQNNLGIPLPAGKVRVFKNDPADDTLEFVGEDKIDHTAADEELSLYIGNAFDITPEYTLVDGTYRDNYQREVHKIELRNAKETAVMVMVEHQFAPRRNWRVQEASHSYEKTDANTIRFAVKVAAKSSSTLKYTTTETW